MKQVLSGLAADTVALAQPAAQATIAQPRPHEGEHGSIELPCAAERSPLRTLGHHMSAGALAWLGTRSASAMAPLWRRGQEVAGPALAPLRCLVPTVRFGAAPRPGKRIDEALACLERGQWLQAYALFAGLADEGDAHAARVALLMQRNGTRLFGGQFQAGATRRARWLDATRC